MRNRILVAAAMTAAAVAGGCKKDEPKPATQPVAVTPAAPVKPAATVTPAPAAGGTTSTTQPAAGPTVTIGGPTTGPAPMAPMPLPGTARIPLPPTRPAGVRVHTTGPTTRRSPLDVNKDDLNK
ncbi:MAG TPA: hypothetical protein VF796_29105 [Humisphaera sp.]